ncbi:MAG: hypothetical protein RL768_432 [Nitrospirota bacterium]|jgi:uncharacterized protein with HEPN domain
MNWEVGNKLMVGILLLGGVVISQPAYAIQPWDVDTDTRISNFIACKAEARAVILEAAYQRSISGVTKDPYLKGIIGSVDRVVLYIAAYEASTYSDTLAGSNAVQAALDLIDKLTAAIANSGKKNPQVTSLGGQAIRDGIDRLTTAVSPSIYVGPQGYNIYGTLNYVHYGANGLYNCVDTLVNGIG